MSADSAIAALGAKIAASSQCAVSEGAALSKVLEALQALQQVGVPVAGLATRLAEKTGLALLALADLPPGASWAHTKDITNHTLSTRGVIRWVRDHYGDGRSDGSYDYVLRQDLSLMLRAGLVQNTGRLEGRSHNDSTRAYGLEPTFAALLCSWGTNDWETARSAFVADRPAFEELEELRRDVAFEVHCVAFDGSPILIELGPGGHNHLIAQSVEVFLPRFGPGARILYLGDADDRDLYLDTQAMRELRIDLEDVLPDAVAYAESTGWLWIIEAVHSRGPVSHDKHARLEELLKSWRGRVVYVSTFHDRAGFRKCVGEIAWETEVWVADEPEHLIHFNGDRFLGPH